jgi:hypothetical protein
LYYRPAMSRIGVICSALLVIGAAGCDKGAVSPSAATSSTSGSAVKPALEPQTPRPPAVKREHIQAAEAMIAELEVLGIALQHTSDCAAAAGEVDNASKRFATLRDAMKQTIEETNADPAARAWFETNYKARMQEASMPLMKRAATCIEDPAFKAALDRAPMLRKKSA